MASKGGRVRIFIETDADQAEKGIASARRALDKMDGSVKKTATSQAGASRTSKDLDTKTRNLSGSMRSAAKYAAGAAAAYISIAEAKEAVETTQDLAKTTAGLHRNLGLTNKTASEWGAIAKSRDIDTKSLNMSFTTLSRRLTDAAKGSDTALGAFKDVGLTQKDLEKSGGDFNKQLLTVADAFGEAEGGAKRQQAAQQLLGRGYQTLLPLFADGSKGLKEQQEWADKYGATLSGKTVKAQMEAVQSARESKVALLGLKVSFATAVTPAVEEADKKFQGLAKIMADDRLSDAEKFDKIGHRIGHWAEDAEDAFIDILPDIAQHAGEAAPKVALALADGFLHAPALGKLALGAWFIRRLGGPGAMTAIGRTIGTKVFGGMAATEAMPGTVPGGIVAAPTKGARLAGLAKGVGGLALLNGAIDGVTQGGAVDERLQNAVSGATFGLLPSATEDKAKEFAQVQSMFTSGLDEIHNRSIAASEGIKRLDVAKQLLPTFQQLGAVTDAQAAKFTSLADSSIASRKALDRQHDQMEHAFAGGIGLAKGLAKDGDLSHDEILKMIGHLKDLPPAARDQAADAMVGMAKQLEDKGKLPENSAAALRNSVVAEIHGMHVKSVKESEQMIKGISKTWGSLVSVVGGSLSYITNNTSSALQALGEGKPVKFALSGNLGGALGSALGDAVGALEGAGHQRGSFIPGFQTGDVIPAMLEPGEFVLNRNAVAAMGLDNIEAINSAWPRFQKGGHAGPSAMQTMINRANAWDRTTEDYLLGGGHSGWVNPGAVIDCSGFVSDELHQAGLLSTPMATGALASWGRPAKASDPLKVYVHNGGAAGGHTILSLNGRFAGTSASNPGGGAGWIDGLKLGDPYLNEFEDIRSMDIKGAAGAAFAGSVPKIKAPHLSGPGGPLRRIGQGSLNRAAKAANRLIARKTPAGSFGGGDAGSSAVPVSPGGWKRVGATYEGLTGAHTGGGVIGGMNFAELLVAGDNAGFHDQDLSATLGLPNPQYGMPFGTKLGVRMPGAKKAFAMTKNDNGSGQPGNPHFKVDLQDQIIKSLGWAGNADVEVKRLQRGGKVGAGGFVAGPSKGSHKGPLTGKFNTLAQNTFLGGTQSTVFQGNFTGPSITNIDLINAQADLRKLRQAEREARGDSWMSDAQWAKSDEAKRLKRQEQRELDHIAALKENTKQQVEVQRRLDDLTRSRRRIDALSDAEFDRAIGDRVGAELGARTARRRTAGDGTQGYAGMARSA